MYAFFEFFLASVEIFFYLVPRMDLVFSRFIAILHFITGGFDSNGAVSLRRSGCTYNFDNFDCSGTRCEGVVELLSANGDFYIDHVSVSFLDDMKN